MAVVMSKFFETQLIRLQCHEGLNASTALYEWNPPKQLLHIRSRNSRPSCHWID